MRTFAFERHLDKEFSLSDWGLVPEDTPVRPERLAVSMGEENKVEVGLLGCGWLIEV